ncbi:Uncharacterised protein [Klebsiella michiganensis]|nr:Uncharacterised protein [Klebsiella michiganensis]
MINYAFRCYTNFETRSFKSVTNIYFFVVKEIVFT